MKLLLSMLYPKVCCWIVSLLWVKAYTVYALDLMCARWRATGNETITLAAISCTNGGSAQIALVTFNDGQSSLVILIPKRDSNHR